MHVVDIILFAYGVVDESDEGRWISLEILFVCGIVDKPDEGVWRINQWFVEDWESSKISDCKFWLHCRVH